MSGATLTSRAISEAVKKALAQATRTEENGANAKEPAVDISSIPDGVYRGTGTGFGGTIVVDVTVSGGKITAIDIVEHADTQFIAQAAFSQMIPAMIEQQTIAVDVRASATLSSKGLLEAVEAALTGKEAK